MAERQVPQYRDVRPVRDLVSERDCALAQKFLAETAHEVGVLQAQREYHAHMIVAAEAVGALYSEERSADKRKYEARTTPHYLKHIEEHHRVSLLYYPLKAKRDSAVLTIELYRTVRVDKRIQEARS